MSKTHLFLRFAGKHIFAWFAFSAILFNSTPAMAGEVRGGVQNRVATVGLIAKNDRTLNSSRPYFGTSSRNKKNLAQKFLLRKDQTAINLSAVDIEGEHKSPAVSSVLSGRQKISGELLPIRNNWRDHLIRSTGSLR